MRTSIDRERKSTLTAPALLRSSVLVLTALDPRPGEVARGARCAPARVLRPPERISLLTPLSPPPKLALDFPGSVSLGELVPFIVGSLTARQP
jgi:hypothetical protein